MSAPDVRTPGCNPADAEKSTDSQIIPPACFLGNRENEYATLQAQFALADHQVHKGGNGDFIVTRWGMSRFCENPAALRRFALVLGVQNVPY